MRWFSNRVRAAAKTRIKVGRALLYERFGSDRYSYPALNSLDRQMLSRLPDRPGTFLEIGANDGYSQSNTWYLERHRRWTGVLVEPLPELYRACRKVRRRSAVFNYACVGPDGPAAVELVDRNLMSVTLGMQDDKEETARLGVTPRRVVTAQTTTLSDLIDRAGIEHLDFMSVDVEGAELNVLSGLDLTRHCPAWLLVETKHREQVAQLLASHLVHEAALSHHDHLFRRL